MSLHTAAKDDPAPEDLYEIGSIANILQMLKLPDGTVKVLVEGRQRISGWPRFSASAEVPDSHR